LRENGAEGALLWKTNMRTRGVNREFGSGVDDRSKIWMKQERGWEMGEVE
jgi:hypothetical protein